MPRIGARLHLAARSRLVNERCPLAWFNLGLCSATKSRRTVTRLSLDRLSHFPQDFWRALDLAGGRPLATAHKKHCPINVQEDKTVVASLPFSESKTRSRVDIVLAGRVSPARYGRFAPLRRSPERGLTMATTEKLGTHHKALTLNLDESTFGPFAEIGAGQEVLSRPAGLATCFLD
jgi:hypothetical protein